jgi:uncharacterized protein (UPF0333 family)
MKMQSEKIIKLGTILMLSGICISVFAFVYFSLIDSTKDAPLAMSNANAKAQANANANSRRAKRNTPYQATQGPYNSSTTMSCASEQLDKLDDCDDDNSPNVGSDWQKYILNQ